MTNPRRAVPRGAWWRWGLAGAAVTALTLGAIHATKNVGLFPTLTLAANLTVPGAVLVFVLGRVGAGPLGLRGVVLAFAWAAFVATSLAAVVEHDLVSPHARWTPAVVAVVEEGLKLACVLIAGWGLWRHKRGTALDGLVLGVAAGAGFAVLESAGFTFTAFLKARGALTQPMHLALLRASLAPMGHVAWTGLIGTAWFAARENGHWGRAAGATLGVLGLHMAWDAFPAGLRALGLTRLPVFADSLLLALIVGLPGLIGLLLIVRRVARDAASPPR